LSVMREVGKRKEGRGRSNEREGRIGEGGVL
jgi:hypothetical protein